MGCWPLASRQPAAEDPRSSFPRTNRSPRTCGDRDGGRWPCRPRDSSRARQSSVPGDGALGAAFRSGSPRGSSWTGPPVPDLPPLALQPGVDPAAGNPGDDLPEPELLGGKAPALVPLDPGSDGLVPGRRAEPRHRLPGTRGKDAADDLLPIPVPAQPAGIQVPEQLLDRGREGARWLASACHEPILRRGAPEVESAGMTYLPLLSALLLAVVAPPPGPALPGEARQPPTGEVWVEMVDAGAGKPHEGVGRGVIEAPPERVVRALIDYAHWQEFMPFLKQADAQPQADGSVLGRHVMALPAPLGERRYRVRFTQGMEAG